MLEYSKYHVSLHSDIATEDVFTDVADDLRGLSYTISSLGEAPGVIEHVQAKMLGDVAGFLSEAVDDLLIKLYGNPEMPDTAATEPEDPQTVALEITSEDIGDIMMDLCAISAVIKNMEKECSELAPINRMLYRELGNTLEKLERIERAVIKSEQR